MITQVRTPHDIFFMPQRLLVPLFQRPYVWSLDAQWLPLWEDVRRLTERRIAGDMQATHFLGAVVLQQQANHVGALAVRTIIDGQQRLTTLQLFLDSLHGELERRGYGALAHQIADLVENAEHFRSRPEDRYKVWPTNRDRAAFTGVMSAPVPVDYTALPSSDSRLAKAHEFFTESIRTWLDAGDPIARAGCLVPATTSQLQLVAIELQYDEDAQEIFETLNARGTPLTPADLIKNFVFQRLDAPPAETEAAYRENWADFETPFWEKDVSSGRVTYSRSSLFLNHWLVATTLKDVPAREVFSQFKHHVIDSNAAMGTLLPKIKTAADSYRGMLERAADRTSVLDPLERFVYRTGNLESEIVKPLLIWLTAPEQADIPIVQRDKALAVLESWLVRRALVRAQSAGTNQFLVALLVHLARQDHDRIGDAAEEFLAKQDGPISYWPGDAEVRRELASLQIYRRLRRGRLRMVLEAVEDHLRGFNGTKSFHEQPVIREVCTIEHVMPQEWRRHWTTSVETGQEGERDRIVQTLGNLTLVTKALNSKVSNAIWSTKRTGFDEHTSLFLTKEIVDGSPDSWTDDDIRSRTKLMIDRILQIWPVPTGHAGVHDAGSEKATSGVEVADLVNNDLLAPGTTLYARPQKHRGKTAVVGEDGRLSVNGVWYDYPSSAARAVTGSLSEPGWWFWLTALDGTRSLSTIRQEYLDGFDDAPELSGADTH
jgi:hypothetical protein